MSLPRTITLIKNRGETPLETIQNWKARNPAYACVVTSYAGRLDPMAEGKLLVLLGDECKRQSQYTKLDKEYVIEVLLDFGTDTGDVLGLPKYSALETKAIGENISPIILAEKGTHSRAYPVFSSKTVQGKPLFLYALEGTLDTITIPKHSEKIYSIQIQTIRTMNTEQISQHIQNLLQSVPRSDELSKALGADFRQDEIRERWHSLFKNIPDRNFSILTLRVTCGSGTYMRTLAERIGVALGTKALALSINRTKVGSYKSLGRLGFWLKSY